jgi:hypothetical protein
MNSPVLLLAFNRPDCTSQVFEAIRARQPARLYVAVDGPRPNRPEETELCDQVRRIVSAVDWPCRLRTKFRHENLGCRQAVSGAIDWFFQTETEGIILEDDCLPHPSFFDYCDELLGLYRHEPRVMVVSGDNTLQGPFPGETSYLFSRYPLIWGWATWARAWKHYDWSRYVGADRQPVIDRLTSDPRMRLRWTRILQQVADGTRDTWDYPWNYFVWEQGGLSAIPAVNLVSNIGIGDAATRPFKAGNSRAVRPTFPMEFPLKHPNLDADAQIDSAIETQIHHLRPA